MIIAFSAEGGAKLRDSDNFKEFKVVVPTDKREPGSISSMLGDIGALTENAEHVWISIPAFLSKFAPERCQAWNDAFTAMVAKVKQYGYVNDTNDAVRAHIETEQSA